MMLLHTLARLLSRATLPLSLAATFAVSACAADATSPITDDAATGRQPKAPKTDTASTPPVDTTSAPPVMSTSSVLIGATMYVDPFSSARKTADSWRATRPADALQMDKIAAQPTVKWFGSWNTTSGIATDVGSALSTMSAAGALPVFVAYNIPQRDCGGLSGSDTLTPDQYKVWIDGFAKGIGARRAVVILEPDALAAMTCLSAADQQTRVSLIAYAVRAFKTLGNTAVYVDAGNPTWQTPATMATRLQQADIADATGFSLNVSNFILTADNISYGQKISALVGSKHFVIDTGRNGLGPTADFQWCNPSGRALGNRPSTNTGIAGVDAYLWIKVPGESDGACNGYPAAGEWMPEYALGLAQRA
jgi:endoglucanase